VERNNWKEEKKCGRERKDGKAKNNKYLILINEERNTWKTESNKW
jgi:hypothetical protein